MNALRRAYLLPVALVATVGVSCGDPSEAPPSSPTGTNVASWRGAPPHGLGPFTVSDVRVIDGDSIEVLIQGARAAVRLAGVDAPEGNTACGRAATAQLQALAARGLTLTDDADPSLTFDSRGLRLFHATDASGRLVSEVLVRAGVARALAEGQYADLLAAAQADASSAKRGCVWGGPTDPVSAVQPQRVATVKQAISNLPGGFSQELVTGGFSNPTAFATLPDGRILIAEKTGVVRVFKNGALLPTPLIDIRPKVNDYWDHGLLGIAADPDFAVNGYVYLLYVYENDATQYSGTKTSRLSRFTAVGDVASTSTELVVLGSSVGSSCALFPAGADCIPAEGFSHSVGSIRFATDKTMYVTTGDASSFNFVDDNALRSQDLDSLAGKMMHVDRTGAGLSGNPFWNGNAAAARSKVWLYGLRNAYRFHLRPGTNMPYLGDVGWDAIEEINVGVAGANLGWPCYEGVSQQPGYASKPSCQTLYARGTGAVRAPLIQWNHDGVSSASTGGTFYTGTAYPAQFQGAYFYGDYAQGFIRTARVDANDALTSGPADFAAGAEGPVDFGIGPSGDLYYISINRGELRRLRYNVPTPVTTGYLSDQAWTSATNGWGPVEKDMSNGETAAGDGHPLTIGGVRYAKGLGAHAASDVRYALSSCSTFTAQVGVDDEVGSAGSVIFQVWTDGIKAYESPVLTGAMSAAAVSVNLAGKSELRLVVTDAADGDNSDHADWADAKVVCGTTTPTGTAPVATISAPAATLTYKVGDVIDFGGSATDAEDGAIPASGLSWQVIIHHCPGGACHDHTLMTAAGASGSFTVPDHGDESYFEIILTARDSAGMSGTTSVSIQPQTVQLTLATSPPGLQVVYGGTSYTAPKTVTTVVGSSHTITAPTPQTLSGTSYTFSAWSDGGAQQHTITTGTTSATYTATFSAGAPPIVGAPSNLKATAVGSAKNLSITLRWTDNATNESRFVIERSTASKFDTNLVRFETAANVTTFTDKSLANTTTYFYRVYAATAAGDQSAWSNVASATTR
jgi:glucose/arabinose dehydrogenase